ncbi:MAG: site-2 protease family protein [Desulfurococcales archaeon]|nr:site-2 protease family protein [Desulfurococcales archaeon]
MATDTSLQTGLQDKRENSFNKCAEIVGKFFETGSLIVYNENTAELQLLSPKEPISWKRALLLAYDNLVPRGCYVRLVKKQNGLSLVLYRSKSKGSRRLLGIILAGVTLLMVYVSGLALSSNYGEGIAWSPLGYLLGLLVPLLAHELGHWITLRRYRTPASIPYFIPAPPIQLGFIGTFGAVINMRWLPPTARALSLSSIMGPLTGFLAAFPFAYYGVKASIVLPAAATGGVIPFVPLIMLLIPTPVSPGPHEVIILSPMGFAAFIVFVVTFLNLLPVASLDGGHIVRALAGFRLHYLITITTVILLIVSSTLWPGFTFFALLAIFIFYMNRHGHPGTALGIEEVDSGTALAGILFGLLLILTMPIPVT